jgi:hypothetical protein
LVQKRAVEVDLIDTAQRPAGVADGAGATAGHSPDDLDTRQRTGHSTFTSMST